MAADPTPAVTALLASIPSTVRALAAAHAEADHWRIGLEWTAVGVALILFQQSRFLLRVQARLAAILGREAMASILCASLLVATVEAVRMLATALAAAIWSRAALTGDLAHRVIELPAEAAIGGIGLWALLYFWRWRPRFGWAWLSLASAIFIFAAVLLAPVTLSPWARGDQPVSGPGAGPLLAFAQKGDLDARTLYVFGGADPLAVDMEGVGPVVHAAVSRAALENPTAETYAAIGHLLGHHHHRDLYGLALLWSAVAAFFFWLVWTACLLMERRTGRKAAGFDAEALPVVALIGWGVLLLATPTFNLFDQIINYRADEYALSLTHDPDALCRWLMTAEAEGKADPSPVEALLFYDHPPLKSRLLNVMLWKMARSRKPLPL